MLSPQINTNDINFDSFDQKLIKVLKDNNSDLGLDNGKMGFVIYFYNRGRLCKRQFYTDIAGNILDDILYNISENKSLDILNGLTGIGLGFDYLLSNKFVTGNINTLLKDIDSLVFKQVVYPEKAEKLSPALIIDIIIYLVQRHKRQNKKSEAEYLFNELLIVTVNLLHRLIDYSFFEEPTHYKFTYQVPLSLFALSKVYSLNIFNNKIEKLLEEFSYKYLSTIPILTSNRLLLLWGMQSVNRVMDLKEWSKHSQLIFDSLDIEFMINYEFRDKNIFFNEGLTSIFMIINDLSGYFSSNQICAYKHMIIKKILSSDSWRLMEDENFFRMKKGLLSGYCGTSLLVNHINDFAK